MGVMVVVVVVVVVGGYSLHLQLEHEGETEKLIEEAAVVPNPGEKSIAEDTAELCH